MRRIAPATRFSPVKSLSLAMKVLGRRNGVGFKRHFRLESRGMRNRTRSPDRGILTSFLLPIPHPDSRTAAVLGAKLDPAFFETRLVAARLFASGVRLPFSKSTIVFRETTALRAKSAWSRSTRARAARLRRSVYHRSSGYRRGRRQVNI